MPRTPKIDALPGNERKAVIDAITEALVLSESPDYRGLQARLAQQLPGFKALNVSHNALWRFARDEVRPKIGDAVARVARAKTDVPTEVITEQRQKDIATANETKAALNADPIVSALMAKRERLESAISETHADKQWDAYAKLEGVDLKAIEMYGRASMHPGFSTVQQTTSTTNNIVVVMPGAAAQPALPAPGTGVIDAEVVDVE